MVRRANDVVGGKVNLAIGGLHLGEATPGQIEGIIADLEQLGAEHCTGDQARRMFSEAFGAKCILAGAGQVIVAGSEKVQAK